MSDEEKQLGKLMNENLLTVIPTLCDVLRQESDTPKGQIDALGEVRAGLKVCSVASS